MMEIITEVLKVEHKISQERNSQTPRQSNNQEKTNQKKNADREKILIETATMMKRKNSRILVESTTENTSGVTAQAIVSAKTIRAIATDLLAETEAEEAKEIKK